MSSETQRFTVGAATITSVVEDEVPHIPPELFFPEGSAPAVAKHEWLVPDYADADGHVTLRVQAFVLQLAGRTILIDPCVGNNKARAFPFWNQQSYPFLERFTEAGFAPASVDMVVHTHLHADHVGWDTHLVDGAWIPTFTQARHLYTQAELDFCRDRPMAGEDVFADSVAPILAAGLADVVDEDAELGDGIRLVPTPGHTPGHVSVWIESDGDAALLTGDFMHHPVQLAEPNWAEIGDDDVELARATRRRMIRHAAETGALVLVAHFATHPAGRIVADGDAWAFIPA